MTDSKVYSESSIRLTRNFEANRAAVIHVGNKIQDCLSQQGALSTKFSAVNEKQFKMVSLLEEDAKSRNAALKSYENMFLDLQQKLRRQANVFSFFPR
jgi:protein-arginine kinase